MVASRPSPDFVGTQRISDGMIIASARALAEHCPALKDPSASLLPDLKDIRSVAVEIAYCCSPRGRAIWHRAAPRFFYLFLPPFTRPLMPVVSGLRHLRIRFRLTREKPEEGELGFDWLGHILFARLISRQFSLYVTQRCERVERKQRTPLRNADFW